MTKNPTYDVDTKYIRQIQHQQIELALLKAERDAALRDRDLAQARSKALNTLVDALLGSLRPYGFGRKRFLSAIRQAARSVPDQGPDSLQHSILLEGSNRVLGNKAITA
jgi:hypothetical protein